MLSPALPLKLSAAGIRLTGYVIETNLRIARVFGQAALKAGSFCLPLQAAGTSPDVGTPGLGTAKVAEAKAVPGRAVPKRAQPVPIAKPAVKIASVASKPAAPAVEVKPVLAVDPKPAPLSAVNLAAPADVPVPANPESKPVAAPIPVSVAKVETVPDATPKDAGTAATMSARPVAPALAKSAEPAATKRPRAPSMPPALPEVGKKSQH